MGTPEDVAAEKHFTPPATREEIIDVVHTMIAQSWWIETDADSREVAVSIVDKVMALLGT